MKRFVAPQNNHERFSLMKTGVLSLCRLRVLGFKLWYKARDLRANCRTPTRRCDSCLSAVLFFQKYSGCASIVITPVHVWSHPTPFGKTISQKFLRSYCLFFLVPFQLGKCWKKTQIFDHAPWLLSFFLLS